MLYWKVAAGLSACNWRHPIWSSVVNAKQAHLRTMAIYWWKFSKVIETGDDLIFSFAKSLKRACVRKWQYMATSIVAPRSYYWKRRHSIHWTFRNSEWPARRKTMRATRSLRCNQKYSCHLLYVHINKSHALIWVLLWFMGIEGPKIWGYRVLPVKVRSCHKAHFQTKLHVNFFT